MALQKFYWPDAAEHIGGSVKPPFSLLPGYTAGLGGDENPEITDVASIAASKWGTDYDGENYIIVRAGHYENVQNRSYLTPEDGGDVTVESIAEHCLTGMSGFDRWKPWLAAIFQEIKNAGYTVRYVFMDVESFRCSFLDNYELADGESGTDIHMHEVIRHMQNNEESRFEAVGMPEIDLTLLDQPNSTYYNISNEHHFQELTNWTQWAWKTMGASLDNSVGAVARAVWGNDTVVTNYQMSHYSQAPIMVRRQARVAMRPGVFGGYSNPALYIGGYFFESINHCLAALEAIGGDKTKIIPWILSTRHIGDPDYSITEASSVLMDTALENWGITKALVW